MESCRSLRLQWPDLHHSLGWTSMLDPLLIKATHNLPSQLLAPWKHSLVSTHSKVLINKCLDQRCLLISVCKRMPTNRQQVPTWKNSLTSVRMRALANKYPLENAHQHELAALEVCKVTHGQRWGYNLVLTKKQAGSHMIGSTLRTRTINVESTWWLI